MNYCLRCNKVMESGDVHYGQHLECFEEIFSVNGRVEFHSLVKKDAYSSGNPPDIKDSPHLTSYFGGNYRKYEGKLGDSSYILKLSKPEYPELAPVEFVCNKIAYYCGINVPTPFTLIALDENEPAFVSKNFMYKIKTHATLNHIYHYLKKGSIHYNVDELSNVIFKETRSVEDLEMFFKMILFDALIGNHDRHGRNLAFIETASQKRMTPIYDNPSYLGLETVAMLKASFSPRGKIYTKASKEPVMKDYLIEMERLGTIHIAEEFYNNLDYKKITGLIKGSRSLSANMQSAFIRLLDERYKELDDYVRHK